MTEASQQNQPEFAIHKLYTKDLSFEAPNTPAVFHEEWKPELNLNLQSEAHPIDAENYEVVLTVTATAKNHEKTAFIVEVKQAGIFTVKDFPQDQLGPILGSVCPNIIFPYIREVISDVVVRGGFPQLCLAPINFDALYAESLKNQPAQAANQEGEGRSLDGDGSVH